MREPPQHEVRRDTPATGSAVPAAGQRSLEVAQHRWGSARVGPAPARPAIAVLLSRFPHLTETGILREIDELERQGQPIRLVPLTRERPQVMHVEAEAWLSRALFTPLVSTAIVAATASSLARRPLRTGLVLSRVVLGSWRSPRALVSTLALLPKCVYLAQRLEREGIRHVHAHYATRPATAALIISLLAPIQFSFTVHGRDLFAGWRRPLLAATARRARFIRVTSSFSLSLLGALHPESARKIRVIPPGVDPARYRCGRSWRAPATANAVDDLFTPRIVCVAALEPYRGLGMLIEACARLDAAGLDFSCDIVGDGSARGALTEHIARVRLDRRIRLRGALRQDQVTSLLHRASIVVLPSVVAPDGPMEGVPLALLEAMAAARPVIAPAVSAVPEVVDHGVTGLLVEPGSVGALTDAMAVLLIDPTRARSLGRRGRAKVLDVFRLDACTAALLRELDRWNHSPDGARAGRPRRAPRRRWVRAGHPRDPAAAG